MQLFFFGGGGKPQLVGEENFHMMYTT